ncbi:MAG: coenzyme F420-0:L-glutamate ligase [Candidatus Bathyarchaeia archaeon]|nr:coenzyme F420-0:L-glutamate ligase [Candidatus Bathyarchaeia archaeon]
MELYGLKVTEEIRLGTDLSGLIVKEAEKQAHGIREGDIIVVTSKIVSKAEGRMLSLQRVKASKKARLLSRLYRKDEKLIELVLQNSDGIKFVIPIEKLVKRLGDPFKEYAVNREEASKAVERNPYLFMAEVGGVLLTNAGIDISNAPPGYCTLPPENPDDSARRIRAGVKEITDRDVAVVIADTEWKLDKFGSIDVAIGCSGIAPVAKGFAKKDLYGLGKFGGVDATADLLAAAANLLFGQADEGVPIAIVRGLTYEKSEKGIRDIAYPTPMLRKALSTALWENLKFRLVSKLASLFLRK